MRRVPPSIAVVVASSVIWLAVLAGGALAQSAPWRIVQASDGTIYVLAGGSRFAIVPEPISDDDLQGYTDGGPSGVAVLLGSSPSPPADAAPAPPAAPDLAPAMSAPPAAPPVMSAPSAPQFLAVHGATPGRAASVTVQAAPGATCTLGYRTPAGTSSTAQGLGPQTVDGSGIVTWSFLIGAATRPGTGTVTVSCGGAEERGRVKWRARQAGRLRSAADQPTVLGGRDAVALAGRFVQSRSVEDGDHPALVLDEAALAQHAGREGHARASDAQHLGQVLVGEAELVLAEAIVAQQQPAAHALFDRVPPRAQHPLGHAVVGPLDVPPHDAIQVRVNADQRQGTLGSAGGSPRPGQPGRTPRGGPSRRRERSAGRPCHHSRRDPPRRCCRRVS